MRNMAARVASQRSQFIKNHPRFYYLCPLKGLNALRSVSQGKHDARKNTSALPARWPLPAVAYTLAIALGILWLPRPASTLPRPKTNRPPTDLNAPPRRLARAPPPRLAAASASTP